MRKSEQTDTSGKLNGSNTGNGDLKILEIGGTKYRTLLTAKFRNRKPFVVPDRRMVYSTIPGTVIKILTKPGKKIGPGEPIIILETMKMMNNITMLHGGVIRSIHVSKGEVIPKEHLIAELE